MSISITSPASVVLSPGLLDIKCNIGVKNRLDAVEVDFAGEFFNSPVITLHYRKLSTKCDKSSSDATARFFLKACTNDRLKLTNGSNVLVENKKSQNLQAKCSGIEFKNNVCIHLATHIVSGAFNRSIRRCTAGKACPNSLWNTKFKNINIGKPSSYKLMTLNFLSIATIIPKDSLSFPPLTRSRKPAKKFIP